MKWDERAIWYVSSTSLKENGIIVKVDSPDETEFLWGEFQDDGTIKWAGDKK